MKRSNASLADDVRRAVWAAFERGHRVDPLEAITAADLGAAGAYLHSIGHARAGEKMVLTAAKAVGFSEATVRRLVRGLRKDAWEVALRFRPHCEVSGLFDDEEWTGGHR